MLRFCEKKGNTIFKQLTKQHNLFTKKKKLMMQKLKHKILEFQDSQLRMRINTTSERNVVLLRRQQKLLSALL